MSNSIQTNGFLNPWLYEALRHSFGDVRVTNAGLPGRLEQNIVWARGRPHRNCKFSGQAEHYAVDCPFCGDRRKRLSFHYRWGKEPGTGNDFLHLVNCFNEKCVENPFRRQQLLLRLKNAHRNRGVSPADVPARNSPPTPPREPLKIKLPENFVRLDAKACPDEPRNYLAKRGFDCDELADRWGVGFSDRSMSPSPKFQQRLVVPVLDWERPLRNDGNRQRLVGWQARMIRTPRRGEPKYLTAAGMTKSSLLYGLPRVDGSVDHPLVIVEGVTDVWRLGGNTVALLGKVASDAQVNLLGSLWNRPLVVFLDEDADSEAMRLVQRLRRLRSDIGDNGRVVRARLPTGRSDVGECERREAWNRVDQSLQIPRRTAHSSPRRRVADR